MKTIFTFLFCWVSSGFIFAQCPSAGRDSTAYFCKNEPFDVASLPSLDADTGGVFINPMGDTMTTTQISLQFPGQYSFYYHVSDTNCPADTAKYVITIINCFPGGFHENTLENNALIKTNPVNEYLVLNTATYDLLEIYETSGRMILSFSKEKSILDISQLRSGNYLLLHEKDGIRQFQRFLKY